jgi:ADP-ribose pyrophosphatase YjhB (NUDIX family)
VSEVQPRLALVVLEADGGIVLTHPHGGTPEAPASLPSGNVLEDETPEQAAVRLALEQTGLEIELVRELTRFLQEGTPFGTAEMFGFVARAVGGELREGDEGPPRVYPVDGLPAIIPVRAANKRVLAVYLGSRQAS